MGVVGHRDEIRSLEGLLNQLGWKRTEALEAITVTGSRALLREAYHSALIDATEHISSDAHELEWPLHALPRITTAIAQTKALLGGFVELSDTEAADLSVESTLGGTRGENRADRS